MKTMELTPEQKRFFDTFGYLVLPGALENDIGWITEEFEAVFRDRGVVHDGTRRSCIVPFVDQRERLCTLLDHPVVEALGTGLLGRDFNYIGGDGNYYSGDTGWHSDGFHRVGAYLKIALYLDDVARDTGCLRVIPGSHRVEPEGHVWQARQAGRSRELWGVEGRDVPSVALSSRPGDVVAFNHNLMHAAFGGGAWRRMFTLNLCRHCRTPAEIADLENFVAGGARFWIERTHGDIMRQTASPQRMRHLRQVIEHETHLPALAAQARATMSEPARG